MHMTLGTSLAGERLLCNLLCYSASNMFTFSIHHVYNCTHFAMQYVIFFFFVCVWDRALHWQSIQIRERLEYIVEELKSYDIVGLQEVHSLTYMFVPALNIVFLIPTAISLLPWNSLLSSNISRPNSLYIRLACKWLALPLKWKENRTRRQSSFVLSNAR